MQAVVPKAVRAALMMAASISSPYLIAFLVDVLIAFFSNMYRFAVYRKTNKNQRKQKKTGFFLFCLVFSC